MANLINQGKGSKIFCRKKSKFVTHSHPLKQSMNMMRKVIVYHIPGAHKSFATIRAVKAIKVS